LILDADRTVSPVERRCVTARSSGLDVASNHVPRSTYRAAMVAGGDLRGSHLLATVGEHLQGELEAV
jgi:hypothetical protein